jgi:Protein of unknown function (DUF2786)
LEKGEKMNPIIEKIKKLFAMANSAKNHDGSSNEAEASAAMAKAQELLAKYNLDLHTVQDAATAAGQISAVDKREEAKINRSAMYRWQQQFWKRIAEANYCFHWVSVVREEYSGKDSWGERVTKNRKVKRHVILGGEANVAAVIAMGEYLTEVMERELPYTNAERLSNAAVSWREGMAERLAERIEAKMKSLKKNGFAASDGTQVTALWPCRTCTRKSTQPTTMFAMAQEPTRA